MSENSKCYESLSQLASYQRKIRTLSCADYGGMDLNTPVGSGIEKPIFDTFIYTLPVDSFVANIILLNFCDHCGNSWVLNFIHS